MSFKDSGKVMHGLNQSETSIWSHVFDLDQWEDWIHWKILSKGSPLLIKYMIEFKVQLLEIRSTKLVKIINCSYFSAVMYRICQTFFCVFRIWEFVWPECTFLMITHILWFYYLWLTWVHFPNDNTHIVILLSLTDLSALS